MAAIVCFFLPGQAQGAAAASLLYGDANPSVSHADPSQLFRHAVPRRETRGARSIALDQAAGLGQPAA